MNVKFYSVLPAPTQFIQDLEEDDDSSEVLAEKTNAYEVYAVKIPPYGNRTGWVPRTVEVKFLLLFRTKCKYIVIYVEIIADFKYATRMWQFNLFIKLQLLKFVT